MFNMLSKLLSFVKRATYSVNPHLDTKAIVILCPSRNRPCGGVKVLYRQAEILNKLLVNHHIDTYILHPKKPGFKCTWFPHNISSKSNTVLSPHDLIIIPEVMVAKHAPLMQKLGLPYCIYVQNGYFINKGDMATLRLCYANAQLVLAISNDTKNCIRTIFPEIQEDKVLRIHYSVDTKLFQPNQLKQNIISYMPRKLPKHVKLVEDFLLHNLPPHWQLMAIENKSESETAEILALSKIFLSFSEFEGCPLPPVEAALAGNQVVGYTGEGGKEYFHLPNFKEVECGNILQFCQKTLAAIDYVEQAHNQYIHDTEYTITTLSNQYAEEVELTDLETFLHEIFQNTLSK